MAVEGLEVVLRHVLDTGLELLGIAHAGEPLHACDLVDRWRRGEPVVGAGRNLVVVGTLDGGQLGPGGVLAHAGIYASQPEDDQLRVEGGDLLQAHLLALSGAGRLLGHDGVACHEVDNCALEAALCDRVEAGIPQQVGHLRSVGLGNRRDDTIDLVVGLLAVARELCRTALLAQQDSQGPIHLVIAVQRGLDVHAGDADLLLNDLWVNNKYHGGKNIDISSITPTTVDIDEDSFFYGRHVVFTGKLEKMIRRDAMQLAIARCSLLLSSKYLVKSESR